MRLLLLKDVVSGFLNSFRDIINNHNQHGMVQQDHQKGKPASPAALTVPCNLVPLSWACLEMDENRETKSNCWAGGSEDRLARNGRDMP